MKWNTRPLALAVLGVVLMATNALAVASPMTATGPTLTWNTFGGGALGYASFSSIALDYVLDPAQAKVVPREQ